MLLCKKLDQNVTLVALRSAPSDFLVKVTNQVKVAQIAQKPRSTVVTSIAAPQKQPYVLCVHNRIECYVYTKPLHNN